MAIYRIELMSAYISLWRFSISMAPMAGCARTKRHRPRGARRANTRRYLFRLMMAADISRLEYADHHMLELRRAE